MTLLNLIDFVKYSDEIQDLMTEAKSQIDRDASMRDRIKYNELINQIMDTYGSFYSELNLNLVDYDADIETTKKYIKKPILDILGKYGQDKELLDYKLSLIDKNGCFCLNIIRPDIDPKYALNFGHKIEDILPFEMVPLTEYQQRLRLKKPPYKKNSVYQLGLNTCKKYGDMRGTDITIPEIYGHRVTSNHCPSKLHECVCKIDDITIGVPKFCLSEQHNCICDILAIYYTSALNFSTGNGLIISYPDLLLRFVAQKALGIMPAKDSEIATILYNNFDTRDILRVQRVLRDACRALNHTDNGIIWNNCRSFLSTIRIEPRNKNWYDKLKLYLKNIE